MRIIRFENGMLVQSIFEFDPATRHPNYMLNIYGPGHYAVDDDGWAEINRRANENARAWRDGTPENWRSPEWVGL